MLKLSLLGINHKSAPIAIREKVYIPENRLRELLTLLRQQDSLEECVILSTCNRTEIYAQTANAPNLTSVLVNILAQMSGLPADNLRPHLYSLAGEAVVDQAMHVATGLDSMVLGENQVLRQVKNAFGIAREGGFTGPVLNSMFNRVISAGKRARTETEINAGAVSISSTAVALARHIFEDLSQHQVMIIGAGKMSELAVKQLISCGVKSTLVSNRTFSKAQELAAKFSGQAIRFEQIEEYLRQADIVISSTGAPHLLLKKETVQKIMGGRQGRPLFFIDIAVPRDIDPAVGEIEDVFLYDLDDLGELVAQHKTEREWEIPKVAAIIAEERAKFLGWLQRRRGGSDGS